MKNIIEYVKKKMNTFETKKFNIVDSLVLSQFSYINFEQAVPFIADKTTAVRIGELLKAEKFETMVKNVNEPERNIELLFALVASPRFRNIKTNYYINKFDVKLEKQFSALTFIFEDKTVYIAYRGTDFSLIGWKEDLNMAFISPIPSQEEGVKYLESVFKLLHKPKKIILGGHSKGGNIAVYSAMKCKSNIQDRIISIYDHDGPGFVAEVFESSEYKKIKDRIHKTMPQSSLVSMLLEHQEKYSVVKSNRFGFMQHNPFSWIVENDDFCYAEKVSNGSLYMHRTINQWLNNISNEKREKFIEILFQIIGATNAVTFFELSDNWKKGALAILEAYKSIDSETKKFISQTINELVKLSFKNLYQSDKK